MNKSNLIWGIICLVIAGALATANLTLPPESLMFQIGDINMPWVPPVVLGIVGVILLATARSSGEEGAQTKPAAAAQDPEKAALNKRLETIGWGCFLIMLGGFALVPDETIPKGVWSIGIAGFSLALTSALLFSDEGQLFGLAMGGLYSGLCFLFGGYAHQVQKAEAAHEQNQRMFNELQIAHRQLQGYADQVASLAVEHERNRLARDLHDSVTQTAFSMNLTAQSARLLLDKNPPRATGQLLRLEELAANALSEIQSLVSQLRPRSVAEEGLPTALRRLADERGARDGLQVSFEVHGEGILSEAVTTGLYSIAHEALTNVAKHSGVHEATIRLNLDTGETCLEIEDRGLGFDPQAISNQRGHLGLAGMSERAREIGWGLSVESRRGQGTRIRVTENPE